MGVLASDTASTMDLSGTGEPSSTQSGCGQPMGGPAGVSPGGVP